MTFVSIVAFLNFPVVRERKIANSIDSLWNQFSRLLYYTIILMSEFTIASIYYNAFLLSSLKHFETFSRYI